MNNKKFSSTSTEVFFIMKMLKTLLSSPRHKTYYCACVTGVLFTLYVCYAPHEFHNCMFDKLCNFKKVETVQGNIMYS